MASSVVPIHTKRITLASGEWIEVKARLNHGEYQDLMERCYRQTEDGTIHRLPFKFGEAVACAYLVDWSLTGLDDQPLRIRGCSPAEVEQALRLIYQELYTEIKAAIDEHVSAIALAQAEKKTALSTAGGSLPISQSPDVAVGGTSG